MIAEQWGTFPSFLPRDLSPLFFTTFGDESVWRLV